jgi:hypothetical protein
MTDPNITPPLAEHADDSTPTDAPDTAAAPTGMLPGSSDEPQGPEDAAGFGAKRGDYADDHAQRGTMVIPDPTNGPGERRTITVDQNALSADHGDEPGVKGGMSSPPDDASEIPTV